MFNSSIKKQNIKRLEESVKIYNNLISEVNENNSKLYKLKIESVKLIELIYMHIFKTSNIPKNFEEDINKISLILNNNFGSILKEIRNEEKTKINDGISGKVLATGTALVAATIGPIGWAIGGTILVCSTLLSSSKNKKIAEEAFNKTIEIEKATRKLKKANLEILKELDEYKIISEHKKVINRIYQDLIKANKRDYNNFTKDEKHKLQNLIHNTKDFILLLDKIINQNNI